MDIEEARLVALQHKGVTEELFAERWISFRIEGKWFMLIELDTPEPRIAVKLKPEHGQELREQYDGVKPAYHMNKKHWNDLYLDLLPLRIGDRLYRRILPIGSSFATQKDKNGTRERLARRRIDYIIKCAHTLLIGQDKGKHPLSKASGRSSLKSVIGQLDEYLVPTLVE